MSDEFKREIEAVIAADDADELLGVVIELAMVGEDFDWAQERLLELAVHPNTDVRGNALIGLAHLADRFAGLDAARVRPAIEAGLRDAKHHVSEQAEAAREALRASLGWWDDEDA